MMHDCTLQSLLLSIQSFYYTFNNDFVDQKKQFGTLYMMMKVRFICTCVVHAGAFVLLVCQAVCVRRETRVYQEMSD